MRISAENRFEGTVAGVQRNCVSGVVSIDVNGTPLTASITAGSVENLKLERGKQVVAVVNDVDVMLARGRSLDLSARNQFRARVLDIDTGAVNTVVKLRGLGNNIIYSTVSNRAAARLNLREGENVLAVIKASSVMVGLDDYDDELT